MSYASPHSKKYASGGYGSGRSPASTSYGRSPASTPGRRSGALDSPAVNRNRYGSYSSRNNSVIDASNCTIDPMSHPDKLPRPPVGSLTVEGIYSHPEVERSVDQSPSRTPTRRGDDDKTVREKCAGRQFLWTTLESVANRPAEVAANLPIPLAAICTPFADTADATNLPLSDNGDEEPLRCTRCRAYANPFFKWVAKVNHFSCNMCGHTLQASEAFQRDMAEAGHTADEENHPELVFGSMDFVAPSCYDAAWPTGKRLPTACFVVETTPEAVNSGFAAATFQAIQRLVEDPEGLFQRPFGIVTFDQHVTFFTLTKTKRFYSVVMTDLDDPYLPVGSHACFVDTADGCERQAACDLLSHLREEATLTKPAGLSGGCAGGAALRAAVEAVTQMGGGDVLVFHASAPNAGVGSLGPMKSSGVGGSASGAATPALSRGHASSSQSIGAATPAAPTRAADFAAGGGQAPPAGFPASKAGLPLCHKGIPQLPLGGATPIGGRTPGAMSFAGASPGGVSTASKAAGPDCFGAGPPAAASPQQAAFYEEELKRCTRAGVAVSCVTAPAASEDALDVGALQWLPWRTGGETMHFPCFGPEQGPRLEASLEHWMEKMQGSAYACVVKLRCSKGLLCKSLTAPWLAASDSQDQSLFEIPRLPPDASFAFMLEPETETADDDELYSRREAIKKHLYLQVAVLYTNSRGERLLRVHTQAVNVVTSVRMVFQSVSVFPLVALLMKQAAVLALGGKLGSAKPVAAKDFLQSFTLKVLATYHRHCSYSQENKKHLVISKRLSLLPLFVLSMRKLIYLLTSGTVMDEIQAEECLRRLLRMPIHGILAALYPRVYALPANLNDSELPLERPPMQEQLTCGNSPAYLVANAFGAWFWQPERGVHAGASGEGDEAAGEAHSAEELRANAEALCHRLSESWAPCISRLPLGNLPRLPGAGKRREPTTPTRSPRQGAPKVSFGMDEVTSWSDKVLLSSLFVEDEGVTEVAYGEWLNFLQEQVLRVSE